MTDTASTIAFPSHGAGPIYQKADIWIPTLIAEAMRRGENMIVGKTFIDCRLEGPAVLIPVGGCQFDACDMGFSGGDPRNLLLSPVGPDKVIGAVAFKDCTFLRCNFFAVGFTGAPEFLKNFADTIGDRPA